MTTICNVIRVGRDELIITDEWYNFMIYLQV